MSANIFPYSPIINPVAVPILKLSEDYRYITSRDSTVSVQIQDLFVNCERASAQTVTIATGVSVVNNSVHFIITKGSPVTVNTVVQPNNSLIGFKYNSTTSIWDRFYIESPVPSHLPTITNNSINSYVSDITIMPMNNVNNRTVNIDMHVLTREHIFVIVDTAQRAENNPITVNFIDKKCNGLDFLTINENNGYIIVKYVPNLGYFLLGFSPSVDPGALPLIKWEFKDLNGDLVNDTWVAGLSDLNDTSKGGVLGSLTG